MTIERSHITDSMISTYSNVERATYNFAGDEIISDNEYRAVMRNSYTSSAYPAELALNQAGVSLDSADSERLKRVMAAAGWIDDLLDDSHDKKAALELYQEGLVAVQIGDSNVNMPAWVQPELRLSTTLLWNAVRMLPEEQKTRLFTNAGRIGELSLLKSEVSTPGEYIHLLIEESSLSAELALNVLSEKAHHQYAFERARGLIRSAVVCGGLMDSALDLKRDHEAQRTAVPATYSNQFKIIREASKWLPGVIRPLGVRGFVRVLMSYKSKPSL